MGPLGMSAKQHREYLKLHSKEQREKAKMERDESRKQQLHEIKLQEAAAKANQGIGHKEDLHAVKLGDLGSPLGKPPRMNKQKLGIPSTNPMAGTEMFKQGQHTLKYAQGTDTVPAMLTPGEAVIPAPAAQNPKNKKAIQRMVQEGRMKNKLRDGAVDVRYSDAPGQAKYHADGSINIKPSHEGLFTSKAQSAGMGVQEYANKVLAAPEGKYDPATRKQANFAKNATQWHADGTDMVVPSLAYRHPDVPGSSFEDGTESVYDFNRGSAEQQNYADGTYRVVPQQVQQAAGYVNGTVDANNMVPKLPMVGPRKRVKGYSVGTTDASNDYEDLYDKVYNTSSNANDYLGNDIDLSGERPYYGDDVQVAAITPEPAMYVGTGTNQSINPVWSEWIKKNGPEIERNRVQAQKADFDASEKALNANSAGWFSSKPPPAPSAVVVDVPKKADVDASSKPVVPAGNSQSQKVVVPVPPKVTPPAGNSGGEGGYLNMTREELINPGVVPPKPEMVNAPYEDAVNGESTDMSAVKSPYEDKDIPKPTEADYASIPEARPAIDGSPAYSSSVPPLKDSTGAEGKGGTPTNRRGSLFTGNETQEERLKIASNKVKEVSDYITLLRGQHKDEKSFTDSLANLFTAKGFKEELGLNNREIIRMAISTAVGSRRYGLQRALSYAGLQAFQTSDKRLAQEQADERAIRSTAVQLHLKDEDNRRFYDKLDIQHKEKVDAINAAYRRQEDRARDIEGRQIRTQQHNDLKSAEDKFITNLSSASVADKAKLTGVLNSALKEAGDDPDKRLMAYRQASLAAAYLHNPKAVKGEGDNVNKALKLASENLKFANDIGKNVSNNIISSFGEKNVPKNSIAYSSLGDELASIATTDAGMDLTNPHVQGRFKSVANHVSSQIIAAKNRGEDVKSVAPFFNSSLIMTDPKARLSANEFKNGKEMMTPKQIIEFGNQVQNKLKIDSRQLPQTLGDLNEQYHQDKNNKDRYGDFPAWVRATQLSK